MPKEGGAGSTLSNLAARRRMIQKTRESLFGQGERGVEPVQRPIPGSVPAQPKEGRRGAPAAGEAGVSDEARQQMIQETMTTMAQMQAGGRPAPAQQRYQPQRPEQTMLTERLPFYGAENVAAETQFYRLAGRPPSPRELAIFQSRIELERQLGRVPTLPELKMYISRGAPAGPSYPRAFEAD